MFRKLLGVLIFTFIAAGASSQDSMTLLPLDDLSAFNTQAGNWQIVGDVTMNPFADVHEKKAPEDSNNRKKKAKAATEKPASPITIEPGKGILLNLNDDTKKDALITNLQHGDIEIEFDVMIPKGSNSGIYLQGRYEVQLLDSWGVKNPSFSDIGGVYRNWEQEPGKIYMGKAPLTNASKAPGLWQHLKIAFKAPRFNETGKKIANARLLSVDLNGVRIHDNVEVPLPTGGPIENNEVATGPLMIQGDHGAVAFKNIKYKLLKEADFTLSSVAYETYYGKFKNTDGFGLLI